MTLAEWAEMPYSPALLLESRFGASITDEQKFRLACRCGFDEYFEAMYGYDGSGAFVLSEQVFSWSDVIGFLLDDVLAQDEYSCWLSRTWRAGFGLGWLSALALTHREMAVLALEVLTALIISPRVAA